MERKTIVWLGLGLIVLVAEQAEGQGLVRRLLLLEHGSYNLRVPREGESRVSEPFVILHLPGYPQAPLHMPE